MSELTEMVLKEVRAERARQDEKWGSQRLLPDGKWLAILTEELGEVAKAVLEHDDGEITKELIQVGAVAVAWAESQMWEVLRR